MKKTIDLIPKSTKWFFIFNGAIMTAIGVNLFFQSDLWFYWTSILGIILLGGGPMLLIYGIILLSPINKYVPRVQLDETELVIKTDIHTKTLKIPWIDVNKIIYKPLALIFLLKGNNQLTVNLDTNTNKSVEIKKTIRDFAEQENIIICEE